MIEEYEQKLGSMTARFLNSCGGFLQEARDLETLYFQVGNIFYFLLMMLYAVNRIIVQKVLKHFILSSLCVQDIVHILKMCTMSLSLH